jgi:hypothetical protein
MEMAAMIFKVLPEILPRGGAFVSMVKVPPLQKKIKKQDFHVHRTRGAYPQLRWSRIPTAIGILRKSKPKLEKYSISFLHRNTLSEPRAYSVW